MMGLRKRKGFYFPEPSPQDVTAYLLWWAKYRKETA